MPKTNPTLKFQQLYWLLKDLFTPGETGGVFLGTGEALHVQASTFADLGTLPHAVRTILKYLPPKPGEVILTNDPWSGGTLLSNMTLVLGVKLSDKTENGSDVIIAARYPLRPSFHNAKDVNEEGLRIPPTPVFANEKFNEDILNAIASHPQVPEEFGTRITSLISAIRNQGENLRTALDCYDMKLNKTTALNYIQQTWQAAKVAIHELPLGETSLVVNFEESSRIRTQIELTGDKVIIDFAGSTDDPAFAMTDAAAYGACFGALLLALPFHIPANDGSFKVLEVTAPKGTFVHAGYPKPVLLGMLDGVSLVTNCVLKTLSKLAPQLDSAGTDPGHTILDIRFADGKHFFDILPGGTGARANGKGEIGADRLSRTRLQASIEDIEKRFPMQLLAVSARPLSGGKGQHAGGSGLIRSYKLLADAKVHWALGPDMKIEGAAGGGQGEPAEITFVLPSGEKLPQPRRGGTELPANSIIHVFSAGGGGFGAE